MARSSLKSSASWAVQASSPDDADPMRVREWIVLTLGTALVVFLSIALSQYGPLIEALKRLPVFEFIVRLMNAL